MKKWIAVFAAVMMMAGCFAAIAEEPAGETPEMIGMANPWKEVETLEELNEAADVNLCLPGVMGVTDVSCRLLETENGKIAELDFCVNGMAYTLRASGNMEDDISGVYTENGETAFAGKEPAEKTMVLLKDVKLARWFNLSGQYVLMVQDDGTMEAETFEMITDEMMTVTNPFTMPVIAEGDYMDTFSQRAVMNVRVLEDGNYAIEIHWADSAFVDNVWTMTGVMTEDGLLSYDDCVLKQIRTQEDGTSEERVANLIPDGYFVTDENVIFWSGAAEESCRNCEFHLAEQ